MPNIDKYGTNELNIIQESSILSPDDFYVLTELKGELQKTFLTAQIFRTRTEMEISVLNDVKHPTPDSKYWQAVREQDAMFQELVMLSYEYRKNLIEIEKLKRQSENEEDDLEQELLKIEIDKKTFIARCQERLAKDRIREIKEWHEIKNSLEPRMECGTENVDDHQLIALTRRYVYEFLVLAPNASQAEKQNLIGLLRTSLRICRERGLLDKALSIFSDKIQKEIVRV